ncbi:hypothetical protein [Janibacter melonis]|uniref:hypothetical protein n=1 Tax=Janibacter melonis TaxID=262209 RepID=UPI00209477DF|nr:hypothetical protein [Janibacter melonis]
MSITWESRRARRAEPTLLWVVDPSSPVTRADLGVVRDIAHAVQGQLTVEVVVTGEDERAAAASTAVLALLATSPEHPVRVVEDVCRAHLDDALDLADHGVVAQLADRRGLDAEAVRVLVGSDAVAGMAAEDRDIARCLGDPADHALYYLAGREIHRLPGPGSSARELYAALRQVHPAG